MTVAALTSSVEYNGNGVTTVFAAAFRYLSTAHLEVKTIAADGTVATLALGVGYSATPGPTDAGGSVTCAVAPATGTRLRIRRVTPRSQGTDYTTGDTFPAETHEAALDRSMLIDQEQDDKIADTQARAILAPEGQAGLVASGSADVVFGTDATGAIVELDREEFVVDRVTVLTNGAHVVSAYYLAGDGANLQPAYQRAIDAAIGAGGLRQVVNDYGAVDQQLNRTPRTTPTGTLAKDGTCLVVADSCGIDFRGATLNLKSQSGGDREIAQVVGGNAWLGGFMTVFPFDTGGAAGTIDWLQIDNVKVAGKFTGSVTSNVDSNITDKGISFADATFEKVILRNVELGGFAGEVYYGGGTVMRDVKTQGCHFHTSGQSAFNGSNGKGISVHTDLKAGNAYIGCEAAGGYGMRFIGGEFYDCYNSGVFTGPVPDFGGLPFTYSQRDDTLDAPWLHYDGTRFVNHSGDGLIVSSWTRGNVVLVDCGWQLYWPVGHLRDIDLDLEVWSDRIASPAGVFGGPPDLVTQVPGAPVGTFYKKPSSIALREHHKRSEVAVAAGRLPTLLTLGTGLIDRTTCSVELTGDGANRSWEIGPNHSGVPVANFELPLIRTDVRAVPGAAYLAGVQDTIAADTAYKVRWPALTFIQGAGTYKVTHDNTYAYAEGQEVVYLHGGGGTGDRRVLLEKDGTGQKLKAPRLLRKGGDSLRLRYDLYASKWIEVEFTGTDVQDDVFTVATLPAAASFTGLRTAVSDSNAALTAGIGAIVAAGGANVVPVSSDGVNWRIG